MRAGRGGARARAGRGALPQALASLLSRRSVSAGLQPATLPLQENSSGQPSHRGPCELAALRGPSPEPVRAKQKLPGFFFSSGAADCSAPPPLGRRPGRSSLKNNAPGGPAARRADRARRPSVCPALPSRGQSSARSWLVGWAGAGVQGKKRRHELGRAAKKKGRGKQGVRALTRTRADSNYTAARRREVRVLPLGRELLGGHGAGGPPQSALSKKKSREWRQGRARVAFSTPAVARSSFCPPPAAACAPPVLA